jgi:hypothetical protein
VRKLQRIELLNELRAVLQQQLLPHNLEVAPICHLPLQIVGLVGCSWCCSELRSSVALYVAGISVCFKEKG